MAAVYVVAGTVYVVDRITKVLAEAHLAGRPPIEVIPGVFDLRFTTNPGGAFGVLGGIPWLFATATIIVAAVIVAASRNPGSRVSAVAMGLVLAGALGNLTDRVLRGPGLSGEVVDFLDFRIWPVFNVADSAIVVGAILLIVGGLRSEHGSAGGAEPGAGDRPER